MKQRLAILITVLLTVVFTEYSGMASQPMQPPVAIDTVAMPSCMVVVQYSDSIPHNISDSDFNALAGTTIFRLNSCDLQQSDPFVNLLDNVILPMANQCDWTLLGIDIRGGASPDGPFENNSRLASRRASNLLQYINSRLSHQRKTDDIQICSVAEDYNYLLWLLLRDSNPDAGPLGEIINRYGILDHDAIKADMLQVEGGRYWKRLLDNYFHFLRAARVILYFMPYQPVAKINYSTQVPTLQIGCDCPQPIMRRAESNGAVVQRRHMLSIGTNIFYDAFYMPQFGWAPSPNVNIEFFPKRGNFSFRFQFLFPYYQRWNKHKFFQIRDYHFEARRYFKPGLYHTGWYIGAYVNNNIYGIGLGPSKGWQGEGVGGALKAGFVARLGHSKRWRLDFHMAAGAYMTRYDRYIYGNPITGASDGYYFDWIGGSEAFNRRNYRTTWIGPTEVGVSISYDLLFWRRGKKGISFISQEGLR